MEGLQACLLLLLLLLEHGGGDGHGGDCDCCDDDGHHSEDGDDGDCDYSRACARVYGCEYGYWYAVGDLDLGIVSVNELDERATWSGCRGDDRRDGERRGPLILLS